MTAAPVFPAPTHAHSRCKRQALEQARAVCAARNVRLTENRETVLKVLLEHHKPLGAYEIMERIDWRGRKPAPAPIYRALEFFVELGIVHRLESRNTYFACFEGADNCRRAFLICDRCDTVAELPAESLFRTLNKSARNAGFEPATSMLEVRGVCPSCQAAA